MNVFVGTVAEKPDGYCFYCLEPADQYHPVGPLMVTISGPDEEEIHEFCNWECLAHWAARAGGGTFLIDDHVQPLE
jgi:hypothetical protein